MMFGANAVYFSALILLAYLCSEYISYRRRATFSAQNGCKPPPAIQQSKWLIGADMAFRFMTLLKQRTFLRQTSLYFQDTARTFTIQFFGATRIWTIEPENVKAILQSDDFEMGWIRNKAFRPYLGNGVQATNGEIWAHGRALLRPSFTRAQISNLDLYEEHFLNFAALIPEDGSTIDIQKEFHRLTMDVSTEILFGESVQCLQPVVSKETQELEAAFDYATKGVITRFNMGNLIWLHWDPKFTHSVRTVQNYVQKFVEKALQLRHELDQPDKEDDQTGSGRYIFLEALAKDTGDRRMLRDQLLSMMAAGRSNTASLLSLIFYLLARHPSVLQKLRAEIAILNNQPPTFEQLKSMPYLRAVLDESKSSLLPRDTLPLPSPPTAHPHPPLQHAKLTNPNHKALRTHPSAAAKRDTTLPLGGGADGRAPIYVRKGQTVFYHTYALHRSAELWGGDAAEFRPERWAELRNGSPRKVGSAGTAWRFVPFGGGGRICPGREYFPRQFDRAMFSGCVLGFCVFLVFALWAWRLFFYSPSFPAPHPPTDPL
jgi:cytochrome P450